MRVISRLLCRWVAQYRPTLRDSDTPDARMRRLTADQLNELLASATISDMQMVLSHCIVKLYGVNERVEPLPESASAEALSLLQEAAELAARASEIELRLTDRELEVCQLLVLNNAEIATVLGCTERTVRAHLEAAMQKTGAANRTDLALKLTGR